MLAAVQHQADPNIIVPAILTSVPVILAALAGLIVTLRSNRKNRQATNDVHDEIRTNHGLRAGEYLEMIGPLVEWAEDHTRDDNELRAALGLAPGKPPQIP
jgi:hypothetical protein